MDRILVKRNNNPTTRLVANNSATLKANAKKGWKPLNKKELDVAAKSEGKKLVEIFDKVDKVTTGLNKDLAKAGVDKGKNPKEINKISPTDTVGKQAKKSATENLNA